MRIELPVARADDAVTCAMVADLVGVPEEAVSFVWRNDDGGYTFRYLGEPRRVLPIIPSQVEPVVPAKTKRWGRKAESEAGPAQTSQTDASQPADEVAPVLERRPVFLNWVPVDQRERCEAARERSLWVGRYVPVPRFSRVREGLGGWWMTSPGLPGESTLAHWGRSHPHQSVVAIATGLRRLHDRAPVESCPFEWVVARRVAEARRAVTRDAAWREAPDDYFQDWDQDRAYEVLAACIMREPELVVCHGDPCSPNYLISPATGGFTGLVDIGDLGVADRWADLAVASWSVCWNFGPDWENLFFTAYGIDPDQQKIDFYRLLWNVG